MGYDLQLAIIFGSAAVTLAGLLTITIVRSLVQHHRQGFLLTPRRGDIPMADGRGKDPSENKPSTGTGKDKRLKGRGDKPGPKPKK
jgi:hypothetical protein